jgi:hypothetical protein
MMPAKTQAGRCPDGDDESYKDMLGVHDKNAVLTLI